LITNTCASSFFCTISDRGLVSVVVFWKGLDKDVFFHLVSHTFHFAVDLLFLKQGHACILSGHTMINGPLLEILVEVELARDGALLVRPREHTGKWNRRLCLALLDTPASCADSFDSPLILPQNDSSRCCVESRGHFGSGVLW
jgi:hypothetical protein